MWFDTALAERATIRPRRNEVTHMAMVDFVKKIHKHCADDLEPGEQVLATTFGQPPGAIRRQVAWGALGGAVGAIAGDALANKRIEESEQTRGEGITLQIPEGKAVLALSGCSSQQEDAGQDTGKPAIVATTSVYADIARRRQS